MAGSVYVYNRAQRHRKGGIAAIFYHRAGLEKLPGSQRRQMIVAQRKVYGSRSMMRGRGVPDRMPMSR